MTSSQNQLTCPSCKAQVPPGPFCTHCGAIIALPGDTNYFQALGLPVALSLDPEVLDNAYYALSRRLHPDLYGLEGEQAQQASLNNSALVNRGYKTLRSPVERATYWLTFKGEELSQKVPPDLSSKMFDLYDAVNKGRTAREQGEPLPDELEQKLRSEKKWLEDYRAKALANLEELFRQIDAGKADSQALIRGLSGFSYVRTLLRDINFALDE